jgi:hypothetical protein
MLKIWMRRTGAETPAGVKFPDPESPRYARYAPSAGTGRERSSRESPGT